jgi:hypothetical protein
LKSFITILFFSFLVTTNAYSQVGPNFGMGFPFLTQFGVDYQLNDRFTFELSNHELGFDITDASLSMTRQELGVRWHIFQGSFFFGLAYGNMNFSATGTDSGQTVTFDIDAQTLTTKFGWLWGIKDGGLYVGMDFGIQSPMSTSTSITNSSGLPTSNQAYQDAEEAADTIAKASLPVVSFLKLGYLF